MNRRKFLFGALIAPVGAVVAAKIPSLGSNIPKPKTPSVWASDVFPELRNARWGTSMCQTTAHRMHQEALTKWLKEKVDNEVFRLFKGDFDGQKS